MGMPIIKKSNIRVEEAIADLIESIALEEAAIAHILNAEGEKIQRVVYSKNIGINTLLETNKQVENMVDKIVELEEKLEKKLKEAKEILEKNSDNCRHESRRVLDGFLEDGNDIL